MGHRIQDRGENMSNVFNLGEVGSIGQIKWFSNIMNEWIKHPFSGPYTIIIPVLTVQASVQWEGGILYYISAQRNWIR